MNNNTHPTIRHYTDSHLDACRSLWVELTEWHRQIYDSPTIGGSDPGRHFDEHLERVEAELLWVAEIDGKVVGLTGLLVRDGEAEKESAWIPGEHLAGKDFNI